MEQKENNMHEIAEKTKKFMNIVSSPGEGKKQGQLFIIDEQPPVGDNTTIMLHLVYEAAIKGRIPSAYFSPDLSNVQVVNRLFSIVTDIDRQTITDGTLSEEGYGPIQLAALVVGLPKLLGAPLYVDDTPEIALSDLMKKITDLAKDKGVRLVVVNPLNEVVVDGLVFTDGPTRRDYITAQLKALAENLGITIFAVED